MNRITEKLKEQLKRNDPEGYRAFVARSGEVGDSGARELSEAKAELMKSDTGYGTLADTVSRSGLYGGGYEEYLKSINGENYISAEKRAKEMSMISDAKNASGYERYLSDYEKVQKKISEAFIEEMGATENFNVESVFKNAVSRGLSKEHALYASAAAVREASLRTSDKVVSFARRYGLTASQAKRYAKTFGLDSFYLDRIYSQVRSLTGGLSFEYGTVNSKEYLDYLESKYNDKKGTTNEE
ncbi:MAG: hypothetical protein IJY18_05580 [Clostridia bacterium]|nr:hypothetical protein [Clostridia bacterium]